MHFAKTTIITGHYGSGKTNFAVNAALWLRQQNKEVILVDMDIVNPYFRTADFHELCEQHGIKLAAPVYANTNLDLPSLTHEVEAAINNNDAYVIIDVGGDDAGAIALGTYSRTLKQKDYQMFCVVNRSRYLTADPQEAAQLLWEIEAASRLEISGIINNTHLKDLTTAEIIVQSAEYADKIAEITGKPVVCTAVDRKLSQQLIQKENLLHEIFPVDIYVKTPWEA